MLNVSQLAKLNSTECWKHLTTRITPRNCIITAQKSTHQSAKLIGDLHSSMEKSILQLIPRANRATITICKLYLTQNGSVPIYNRPRDLQTDACGVQFSCHFDVVPRFLTAAWCLVDLELEATSGGWWPYVPKGTAAVIEKLWRCLLAYSCAPSTAVSLP